LFLEERKRGLPVAGSQCKPINIAINSQKSFRRNILSRPSIYKSFFKTEQISCFTSFILPNDTRKEPPETPDYPNKRSIAQNRYFLKTESIAL